MSFARLTTLTEWSDDQYLDRYDTENHLRMTYRTSPLSIPRPNAMVAQMQLGV